MRASRPTAKARSKRALVPTTLLLDELDYGEFQALALKARKRGHRLTSASSLIRQAMAEYLKRRKK